MPPDVIHGFWVPDLTGKTDLVPGYENVTWVKTTPDPALVSRLASRAAASTNSPKIRAAKIRRMDVLCCRTIWGMVIHGTESRPAERPAARLLEAW